MPLRIQKVFCFDKNNPADICFFKVNNGWKPLTAITEVIYFHTEKCVVFETLKIKK